MPTDFPPRRFDPAVPEMMDRVGQDFALLKEDLHFIARINRSLGGYRIVEHYLGEWTRDWPRERPLTILDLATGSADIPRQIVQWARARGLRVEITACDINDDILRIAREECAPFPEVRLEKQSVLALPYVSRSFDFVLCSLMLHHFSEADATIILRRMSEIARVAFLVNDLRRARFAIWFTRRFTHCFTRNPIARFDAPASCERAFTQAELAVLARAADIANFEIHRHWAYRMALVGRTNA